MYVNMHHGCHDRTHTGLIIIIMQYYNDVVIKTKVSSLFQISEVLLIFLYFLSLVFIFRSRSDT